MLAIPERGKFVTVSADPESYLLYPADTWRWVYIDSVDGGTLRCKAFTSPYGEKVADRSFDDFMILAVGPGKPLS